MSVAPKKYPRRPIQDERLRIVPKIAKLDFAPHPGFDGEAPNMRIKRIYADSAPSLTLQCWPVQEEAD